MHDKVKNKNIKDVNEMVLDAIDKEICLFRECDPSKNDTSGDEITFERLTYCDAELSKRAQELEGINEECYRCAGDLNDKVMRLESAKCDNLTNDATDSNFENSNIEADDETYLHYDSKYEDTKNDKENKDSNSDIEEHRILKEN